MKVQVKPSIWSAECDCGWNTIKLPNELKSLRAKVRRHLIECCQDGASSSVSIVQGIDATPVIRETGGKIE